MKTIKFRGKRIDNNEWVYGHYYFETSLNSKPDCTMIVEHRPDLMLVSGASDNNSWWREVNPETIGQFTGLQDKNGKDIYEGDIVQYKKSEQGKQESFYLCTHEVVFYKGSFGFQEWYTDENNNLKNRLIHHSRHLNIPDIYEIEFDIEIIGNLHENPELLNES